MRLLLLVFASVLSLSSAASAETKVITGDYGMSLPLKFGATIDQDMGGLITAYIAMYKEEAAKGTKYIIDGPCASACTTILGIVPKQRVCATPRANLGFHSGYVWFFGKWHNSSATKLMWSYYPRVIRRALIEQYGWNGGKGQEHLEMMWLVANTFYKECS